MELNRYIEHTLLKQNATREEVKKLVEFALNKYTKIALSVLVNFTSIL